MSDEERTTSDNWSTEMESPLYRSDKLCSYCGINKVMAESRLFKVPISLRDEFEGRTPEQAGRDFVRGDLPYHRMKEGSNKGCRFCGLLVDAFTAWEKELGMSGLVIEFSWTGQHKDGQFIIELYPRIIRSPMEFFVGVSVFCGTGMRSVSCLKSPFKGIYRVSVTVESQ